MSLPLPIANNTALASLKLPDSLQILQEVDPSSALYKRTRETLEATLEIHPDIPKSIARKEPKFLTIGMATHNDYDGCYFSIQAIRFYHPEILDQVEFVLIDNNPTGRCAPALQRLENWIPNYRYIPYRSRQGTALRDLIFREAAGEFVVCMDSHVLFAPGSLARLIHYFKANRDTTDLVTGPLIADDLTVMGVRFDEVWSYGMFGTWGTVDKGLDQDAPPFEIRMQGLGAFACRRAAWPGFNPRLSGFGGEEGYIHEKIRRAGGTNLCLPFLRWMHRFERPMGIQYATGYGDRIRNYLIIYKELGYDAKPVIDHFTEFIGEQTKTLAERAQKEIDSPFFSFDAVYCINLDKDTGRWDSMRQHLYELSIELGVRRFSAADTPLDPRIGDVLSHRRIIEEAAREDLETVLVFGDQARFPAEAIRELEAGVQEHRGHGWQLYYLAGTSPAKPLAIAFHRSSFGAILQALPGNAIDAALWLLEHHSLNDFYAANFPAAVLTAK